MGARSRRKGAAFELAIAKALREVFPQARRRAMQARGGSEGADIDGVPGWWVECGHGKRMDPVRKWEQAQADAREYAYTDAWDEVRMQGQSRKAPVAITKRDRGPVLVTMALEDWLELVRGRNG